MHRSDSYFKDGIALVEVRIGNGLVKRIARLRGLASSCYNRQGQMILAQFIRSLEIEMTPEHFKWYGEEYTAVISRSQVIRKLKTKEIFEYFRTQGKFEFLVKPVA